MKKTPFNPYTGSVELVDRRTRAVVVLGPEPPGSRWATDRKLLFDDADSISRYMRGPQSVGLCIKADGRRAWFLVDQGKVGYAFLAVMSKPRRARPYGTNGWLVD